MNMDQVDGCNLIKWLVVQEVNVSEVGRGLWDDPQFLSFLSNDPGVTFPWT